MIVADALSGCKKWRVDAGGRGIHSSEAQPQLGRQPRWVTASISTVPMSVGFSA